MRLQGRWFDFLLSSTGPFWWCHSDTPIPYTPFLGTDNGDNLIINIICSSDRYTTDRSATGSDIPRRWQNRCSESKKGRRYSDIYLNNLWSKILLLGGGFNFREGRQLASLQCTGNRQPGSYHLPLRLGQRIPIILGFNFQFSASVVGPISSVSIMWTLRIYW